MKKSCAVLLYLAVVLAVAGKAAPIIGVQAAKIDLSYDRSLLTEYQEPFDIEAYFRLLPKSVLPYDQNRRKTLLQGPAETINASTFPTTVVIDRKNCFLSVRDEGGGGGDSMEIAYWILKDRSRLIAVNRTNWGMSCDTSHLRFFTFKKQLWQEVTNKYLPPITLASFIWSDHLKPEDKNKPAPLYIKLPRDGFNISISLGGEINENGYNHDPEAFTNTTHELVWENERFELRTFH